MISIVTNKPVALDSLDHTHPHGTSSDNSTWAPFNAKLFSLLEFPRLLDIGCAGGGLVKSIIDDGGFAVGVEGSDYSLKAKRAEWATIPGNLFTADATEPFSILENKAPAKFNVITSWEVFEHIPEDKIPVLMQNITDHLANDGIVILSICTISAGLSHEGIEHHITIRSSEWWIDILESCGYVVDEGLTQYFEPDWVRGPINGVVGSLCMVLRQISQ